MKRGLTIGLAIAALGVTVSLVTADSSHESVTAADAVPAYTIMTTLREMGYEPSVQPVRRGPYYVLHATDRRGVDMRVVADAHFGDIVSVTPARPDYAVNYVRGPRIIHVPQPGEAEDSGEFDNNAAGHNDDEAAPPPLPASRATAPPRHIEPKTQRRSDAPREKQVKSAAVPPPFERRTVLSAPPPPPKALSPVYPTPKFSAGNEAGEKFGSPKSSPEKSGVSAAEIGPPATDDPPAAPVEN